MDWTTAFSPATDNLAEQNAWVQRVAEYLRDCGVQVAVGRATKLEKPGMDSSIYIYALVAADKEFPPYTVQNLNLQPEEVRRAIPAWISAVLDWRFPPKEG